MRAPCLLVLVVLALSSCGDDGANPGDGGGDLAIADGTSADSNGTGGDAGPPPMTCTPSIVAESTAAPTSVVGTGTPASCTETAFTDAVKKGGVITFDCGGAATITLHAQAVLRTDADTVIDGGNQITLDGGGTTRLLSFNSPNFLATSTKVTLQHLTLAVGKTSGTLPIATVSPNPNNCSQGYFDGEGGAVYVRDGILHVIDCLFSNNQAEKLGPDVGGGAIYSVGSLDTTVAGSRFVGNSGANGGAIGSLFLAITSYHLYEQPFLKLKDRLAPRNGRAQLSGAVRGP